MRRIFIDTSVLHQEGLASRTMQRLGRLADAGEVEIFVPELVKREFLSKRRLDSFEAILQVQKRLKEIGNRTEHNDKCKQLLATLTASVSQLHGDLAEHIDESFKRWSKRHKVREIRYDSGATEAVLEDYFAGTGAFRQPKCREDIIDAMISRTIRAATDEKSEMFVAVKDGAFKTHLKSFGDLHVIDSISEFLERPDVSAALAHLDEREQWASALEAVLRTTDFRSGLEEYLLSGRSDALESIYLETEVIGGTENLALQTNWGVRLNGIQKSNETTVTLGDARFDGDLNFSIDISIVGHGQLDYAAYYSEYYSEGEDTGTLTMTSMDGDGVCDIRELRRVKVDGYLQISPRERIAPNSTLEAIWSGDVDLEVMAEYGDIEPADR